MRNVVFISKEIGIGYREVIEMPYAIFLSFLKHLRIMQLEQTPEGRKVLYKEGTLYQTEPEWDKLRSSKDYISG
ncbi:hypothetical protein [Brassicibacter mesophilus]|uniref:hypothetical protein n=1 Tax=Brassicibacter mesophilus TaxID=745119 RepID=UPI003D2074FD